jgi:2-polyprenyl-3-methyl-5-hydroxy-6-metoxy-1,4-benzoquinol methylase
MKVTEYSTRPLDSGQRPSYLPKLKEYYKHSEGYREHLEAKGPAYFEQFVKVVVANSSPSDRILDVGCGTGESSREIMLRHRNVVGTDLSRLFMCPTDSAIRPPFVASDASQLAFADQSFDVVCAMEFIEHIWPVSAVLSEMDRVLKPAGRIVLMSPNLVSPMWPLIDIVLNRHFRPPLYNSYREAAAFFAEACGLTLKKMFSREPQFLPREPDLTHADGGGDYDAVYRSNARDIMLFLRKSGYVVTFEAAEHASLRSRIHRSVARGFGSLWTSFLLKATKPEAA